MKLSIGRIGGAVVIAALSGLADFLIIRNMFNEYGTLRGSDYYGTFVFGFAVLFLINAFMIVFCLLPKETPSRGKKGIFISLLVAAAALLISLPFLISKDPARDPENIRIEQEAQEREQHNSEAIQYARNALATTQMVPPPRDGEQYHVAGPFSVVYLGENGSPASILRLDLTANYNGPLDNWTEYPDDAGTIIFLESSEETQRVVTETRRVDDYIIEEYYNVDGYNVTVHIVDTVNNCRYRDFRLNEQLIRNNALDNAVMDALAELVSEQMVFE